MVGSLRDRAVACSTSDRQGSNFESCFWRAVSSHSFHHPQEVILAQFSLYVHTGGLKTHSFHLTTWEKLPANTGHSPNAVSKLGHFLRPWPDIETASDECPLFARTHYVHTKIRPPLKQSCPADARRWINVVLTLVHRLRRWANVKPALIQRLVSAGTAPCDDSRQKWQESSICVATVQWPCGSSTNTGIDIERPG